jgi:hypothetical protein
MVQVRVKATGVVWDVSDKATLDRISKEPERYEVLSPGDLPKARKSKKDAGKGEEGA